MGELSCSPHCSLVFLRKQKSMEKIYDLAYYHSSREFGSLYTGQFINFQLFRYHMVLLLQLYHHLYHQYHIYIYLPRTHQYIYIKKKKAIKKLQFTEIHTLGYTIWALLQK